MSQAHTIPQHLAYIGVPGPKEADLHVMHFDAQPIRRKHSPPVRITYYSLSLKAYLDGPRAADGSLEYALYLDTPHKPLAWDTCQAAPLSGYGFSISAELLAPHVQHYSFAGYGSHEALFLTPEEKAILLDLFEKAYTEYHRERLAKSVLVAYAALILSYTQLFYGRQFQSRASQYHHVVTDFFAHLEHYFQPGQEVRALPTVAYFAERAHLSPNYFGDVLKALTGQPPQAHIQQYVVQLAKTRLRQSTAPISAIGYDLGFAYPAYFTRFFKKETGVTPSAFRHQ
jgi:AraC family transcriptional regulator, transcriptional activator of pobA